MIGSIVRLNKEQWVFDAQEAQLAAGFLRQRAADQHKGRDPRRLDQKLLNLLPGSPFIGRQVFKKQVGDESQGSGELAAMAQDAGGHSLQVGGDGKQQDPQCLRYSTRSEDNLPPAGTFPGVVVQCFLLVLQPRTERRYQRVRVFPGIAAPGQVGAALLDRSDEHFKFWPVRSSPSKCIQDCIRLRVPQVFPVDVQAEGNPQEGRGEALILQRVSDMEIDALVRRDRRSRSRLADLGDTRRPKSVLDEKRSGDQAGRALIVRSNSVSRSWKFQMDMSLRGAGIRRRSNPSARRLSGFQRLLQQLLEQVEQFGAML